MGVRLPLEAQRHFSIQTLVCISTKYANLR